MFGVSLRAPATGLLSALLVAVVVRVLNPLIDMMNHPDHWLVEAFVGLRENMLFIAVASALVMWFVAAIYQGQGVRR